MGKLEQENFFKQCTNTYQKENLGKIYKNTPIPYAKITISVIGLTFAFMLLGVFAEFSEKYKVPGFLNTSLGVAQIYPPRNGTISLLKANEGMHVKKGDKLFIIKSNSSASEIAANKNELTQLNIRYKITKNELSVKINYLKKLQPLLDKKYISTGTFFAAKSDINKLKNELHQIQIDKIKYKNSLEHSIYSPIDGTITNIKRQNGQYIHEHDIVLDILPNNFKLVAQLNVPSSKIGFIKTNDKIAIHFDAYPFRQFGVALGKIYKISQTISDSHNSNIQNSPEHYYTIIAKLDSQSITIHGKNYPLRQGMNLTAIIF